MKEWSLRLIILLTSTLDRQKLYFTNLAQKSGVVWLSRPRVPRPPNVPESPSPHLPSPTSPPATSLDDSKGTEITNLLFMVIPSSEDKSNPIRGITQPFWRIIQPLKGKFNPFKNYATLFEWVRIPFYSQCLPVVNYGLPSFPMKKSLFFTRSF